MVRVLGSCPSQKLPTKASSAIPGRRSSTDAAPGEPQTQAEAHTPARALRRPLEPLPCPPDGRPPRQLLQLCRCPRCHHERDPDGVQDQARRSSAALAQSLIQPTTAQCSPRHAMLQLQVPSMPAAAVDVMPNAACGCGSGRFVRLGLPGWPASAPPGLPAIPAARSPGRTGSGRALETGSHRHTKSIVRSTGPGTPPEAAEPSCAHESSNDAGGLRRRGRADPVGFCWRVEPCRE